MLRMVIPSDSYYLICFRLRVVIDLISISIIFLYLFIIVIIIIKYIIYNNNKYIVFIEFI